MPRILRTTLVPDEAQAAAGVIQFDLPVNPLSIILLTVKALNSTATLTNYSVLAALLSMISNINVRYRGASIIDASLTDLAVLTALLSGWQPKQLNQVNTHADVRAVTVPILFGRRPYDPMECFPATRRGDLILQMTTVIAPTGLDTLIIQAETVELLDAEPTQFVKQTTTTKVHNATGEHDIELPIGNNLLGALLQGPIVPTAASYNATFGRVKLQVDNVETMYSETNWETLHGEILRRIIGGWANTPHTHPGGSHTHTISGSGAAPAAYAQATTIAISGDANAATLTTGTAARTGITGIQPSLLGTTDGPIEDQALIDSYAYLDMDPLNDGQYALVTRDAARVNLRVNTEAASATAMRVIPVELVPIGAGAAA